MRRFAGKIRGAFALTVMWNGGKRQYYQIQHVDSGRYYRNGKRYYVRKEAATDCDRLNRRAAA